MIQKQIVENIITEKIKDSSIFIVEIKIGSSNKIMVKADKPEGISIDECVEISRHVESKLDRDIEDYELEVSSPGLTDPFKVHQQYQKNLNREVEVLDFDGTKAKGILTDVSTQSITISTTVTEKINNKKEKKTVTVTIPFTDIKQTKLILSFK